jgi:hypothetical protein
VMDTPVSRVYFQNLLSVDPVLAPAPAEVVAYADYKVIAGSLETLNP